MPSYIYFYIFLYFMPNINIIFFVHFELRSDRPGFLSAKTDLGDKFPGLNTKS